MQRHSPILETSMDSRTSIALLTDLYEITMAQAYWKSGADQQEGVFHLYFRNCPFGGAYCVACGLATALELIAEFRFTPDDLRYLAGLRAGDGQQLLDRDFLEHLGALRLECDVEAVPEGTVVFPGEPLVRVRGPVLQAQLIETLLLTIINFQTLIATKAARICESARGDPVIEFGLRRAQGIDGGLSASRAAFVGGCESTSNVLAGKLFGIPVRGTHAHSWVLCFESEVEAFDAYAKALPNNCVFLVDTYDTIEGLRHAVAAAHKLRQSGHELAGVRLDSGDLAHLSREARRMLDDAGFPKALIVASGDLDEHRIDDLKRKGAPITVWGVGTRLATAYDAPALNGIYKLGAVRQPNGPWARRVKVSNEVAKSTTPGILQVRRWEENGILRGDVIYDELIGAGEHPQATNVVTGAPVKFAGKVDRHTDLLVPVIQAGRIVATPPPAAEARRFAQAQIARLPAGVRRLVQPEAYPVGLEPRLHQEKRRLVEEARPRSESRRDSSAAT